MTLAKKGTGWLPDLPSFQDYRFNQDNVSRKKEAQGQKKSIASMIKQVGIKSDAADSNQSEYNLKQWFDAIPVEDQETIGSCTAQSGVGLYEYFQYRSFGRFIDGSRLFLYKATRNLAHILGDNGAYLRSTMGAMTLFGIPPEEYWPYEIHKVDEEPPAFCYAFAQNYQAVSYYRLDLPSDSPQDTLDRIKAFIAGGLPSMFGFTVFDTLYSARNGEIPFPQYGDVIYGGHAVIAMGYDDGKKIRHPNGNETTGALMIRNSWGTGWGAEGYGWLPYDYVLHGLATDWWSLLQNEWIDTGNFKV